MIGRIIVSIVAITFLLSFTEFSLGSNYDTGSKSVTLKEVKGRRGTIEVKVKLSDLKKYVDEMLVQLEKEAKDPSLKGMKKTLAERKVNLYNEKKENLAKKPVFSLAIGGTINSWNPAENLMKKVDSDTWSLELKDFRLGDFTYKFVVYHKNPADKNFDPQKDMTWVEDPFNTNKVPDGFDGFNSVLDLSKFKQSKE